jgi:predicted PurR-regulated permease PerM
MDQQPASSSSDRRRSPLLVTVIQVISVVIAAVLTLYVIYLLRKPIGWLVIASFLAIAVSGPVRLLQRHIPRGLGILAVYSAVILFPFVILAVLIPPLVEQGNRLASNAPRYAQQVNEFVTSNQTLRGLDEKYDLTAKIGQQAEKLPARIGDVAGALAGLGAGLVSSRAGPRR